MLNRFLLALTAVVLAVSSLGGAAQAQTVEWRFNNSYAASRPESVQIRAFAADVEKRTNGRMKISVSEGGALGLKDADALRFMQTGAPELGFIWPPFLGRDAPALANIYVYGLVSGADEHLKALPALKAVLKEGIGKWNVEVPGFLGFSIVDASLFCREPVRSLDDLRKKKLRVGSREQVETFKRLGVAAQIVPQNELYSALQTGVVDCALYAARFANTISLQEVAKHVTPTGFPFPPAPYALMAHKGKWAALAPDLKKGFNDAVAELERVSLISAATPRPKNLPATNSPAKALPSTRLCPVPTKPLCASRPWRPGTCWPKRPAVTPWSFASACSTPCPNDTRDS